MKNIFKCCHTSRLLVFWKKIHLLYKSRLSPRKNHPHIWHVVKCCCSDSKIEFSDCQYFSARNNFLIKFNFFDFFRSKPKLTKNGSLQAFGRLCLPRHIHSRCPGWDHHSLKSKLQDHSLTSKLQDHHLNTKETQNEFIDTTVQVARGTAETPMTTWTRQSARFVIVAMSRNAANVANKTSTKNPTITSLIILFTSLILINVPLHLMDVSRRLRMTSTTSSPRSTVRSDKDTAFILLESWNLMITKQ